MSANVAQISGTAVSRYCGTMSGGLAARKLLREHMPKVSFATDIKPLFRAVDISHMKSFGVELDDYSWMSSPDNANHVLAAVSPHDGEPPTMPPGGPYWGEAQLALFVQWQKDGYRP